uniref:serine protease inhibitor Kazal-type 6-like isoform X1 n=2 Tax=Pristiophorus japonicus TaxID=55135 RepID=UPI00398EDDF1
MKRVSLLLVVALVGLSCLVMLVEALILGPRRRGGHQFVHANVRDPGELFILDCQRFPSLKTCNNEFFLVCASDGQQYGNPCILCRHNRRNNLSIFVIHPGFCACDHEKKLHYPNRI